MVTITHLELTDPSRLRPAADPGDTRVERVRDPDLSARLYREVGGPWSWTDRLSWDAQAWDAWTRRVHTDVLYAGEVLAGYYELDPQPPHDVEIAIFGLLAAFHGRGLGGHLLTEAVRRAFALPGTRRVWVHTCTLDGPHALANYRARGFEPFKVEEQA